jgi:hypothetical protein
MATQKFSAKAHTRENYNYSNFHKSLLHENNAEDYALRHIYSLENTKELLRLWGWNDEQIKVGIDNITIDVYDKIVYIHIPGFIVKRGEKVKIRGISRFISKADYVDVLVKRCWSKADPYKLEFGTEWDEFIVKGNSDDFYELKLLPYMVTCSCHAYRGIEKAFDQDYTASKHLLNNSIATGQIPDKHTFAVWKYLRAENQSQYEYCYKERRDKSISIKWEFDPDLENSFWD